MSKEWLKGTVLALWFLSADQRVRLKSTAFPSGEIDHALCAWTGLHGQTDLVVNIAEPAIIQVISASTHGRRALSLWVIATAGFMRLRD